MPHSLRVRLKNLNYKGLLTDRELNRLVNALDTVDSIEDIVAEVNAEHNKLYNADTLDEWQQGEHYAYHRVLQMFADKHIKQ